MHTLAMNEVHTKAREEAQEVINKLSHSDIKKLLTFSMVVPSSSRLDNEVKIMTILSNGTPY